MDTDEDVARIMADNVRLLRRCAGTPLIIDTHMAVGTSRMDDLLSEMVEVDGLQGRWFKEGTDARSSWGNEHAFWPTPESLGTMLIYEPLNRYETNMANTMQEGAELLRPLATKSVKLLADLFHMNIEEVSIADALRVSGSHLGHVHFVDSNRKAAGMGHFDFAPIAAALNEINFQGYASAEALPLPTSQAAAKATIESYRKVFGA